jgi:hypothetical protein
MRLLCSVLPKPANARPRPCSVSLRPFVTPEAGGTLTSCRPGATKPHYTRGMGPRSPARRAGPVTGHTKEPAADAGHGDCARGRRHFSSPYARRRTRPAGKRDARPNLLHDSGPLGPDMNKGARSLGGGGSRAGAGAAPGRRRAAGRPRGSTSGALSAAAAAGPDRGGAGGAGEAGRRPVSDPLGPRPAR